MQKPMFLLGVDVCIVMIVPHCIGVPVDLLQRESQLQERMSYDLKTTFQFRVDDMLGAKLCQSFCPIFCRGAGNDGHFGSQVTCGCHDKRGSIFIRTSHNNGACTAQARMGQHLRVGGISKKARDALPPQFIHALCIRLDNEILAWFREQVDAKGGGSYQTMINHALREHIERGGEDLGAFLRRIIREELNVGREERPALSIPPGRL